ncbi:Rossmann-like domain-containing protein [Streptomyces sp. NBRC 109706]|uniref:Rossmann-like domain-containing protein n=1 Tax=Streptomyces sp. NBRC 109706 TaxID=1550035 RepID=UPI000781420B|nr:DUF364 domain-containing protein [Streptomyces sp. NBRC 109706]
MTGGRTALPSPTADRAVSALVTRALAGEFGPAPAGTRVSLAFDTRQAVRHRGRSGGYRNEVLSLRVADSVGSCAVEPGTLSAEVLDGLAGAELAGLLRHPRRPVRLAALDAYLGRVLPHTPENGARRRPLPAGDSLARSRARAAAVVGLLPEPPLIARVLVVGVVNSLLEALRWRGLDYLPCDLKGGRTEWDEPVSTDALARLDDCDALLVSGMTLGNGTFDPLLDHARATGKPLVLFAQSGAAVAPRLLGAGVSAVSAEPYPFFWLDGGPGAIHLYGPAGPSGPAGPGEEGAR